ncbi:hypothetical protein BC629DRAFT_1587204 [Irpex lacteus]|nr:hypothetical protein BC629DRAFT_1587204 [Irpex lacteus]
MALPDVETFIGPCFAIIWVSFILYGLVIAQVYFYFTTYEDGLGTKLLVILLCALETLHVAFCGHVVYTYTIVYFAKPEKVNNVIWSVGAAVYCELVISLVVQAFYIYRLWRLSRNVPILAYLIVGLCARFVIGAIVDSSITIILTAYLSRLSRTLARKRSTKRILRKLIYYALCAGALTMFTSITTLILFDLYKSEIHYAGTLMLLAKVYANSMLAMLNIRQGIAQEQSSPNPLGDSLQLSDPHGAHTVTNRMQLMHKFLGSNIWKIGGSQPILPVSGEASI